MKIQVKIFFFFLLLNIFFSSNTYSQFVVVADYVLIAGYVLEEESLEPVPYVNIYVKETRRGTITNKHGHFILKARMNDTIVFSSIGYKRKYAAINDSIKEMSESLVFLMPRKYYEFESVDIIALRRYQQLKYEIVNMILPEDGFTYAIQNFPKRPVDIDYHSRAGLSDFGYAFSPITALYDAFSREGRERRKLQELIERDKRKAMFENKISINRVQRITNLSEHEAEKFLEWCNFPLDFILRLNDYELIALIMQRFERYKTTDHYLRTLE